MFKIFAICSVTDVDLYAKGYDRSTVLAFANMLKSPKNPDETYAVYPSVLFKNYEVNNTGLFGSVAIVNVSLSRLSSPTSPHDVWQILKATLYGPSSVSSTTEIQRSGPRGSARTWELKTITPGSIAMAAVVVSDLILP